MSVSIQMSTAAPQQAFGPGKRRQARSLKWRKSGFHAGPSCEACQREFADQHETLCYRCRAVFRLADHFPINEIRDAMVQSGIPLRRIYQPRSS